jgi:peptidoglycan/LPS O-acetylase OafA/YrhL
VSRIPQLDGLRAVAVTCVMAFHFIPWVDRYATLGSIGVRLFFVLSGFLITRILLADRARDAGAALRSFYIRRSLRIFPVFYLVLAIAWAMNIGPVRSTIGWHLSYLTNVYLFDRGSWHGSISHLWSLAVEEQFYLVWPWLIVLVAERWLPSMITVMICMSPVTRLLIGGPMNSVLPTSCLDALGAGALLAFPAARKTMMSVGARAGVPLLAAMLVLRGAGFSSAPYEVALDLGVSLSAAWLVGAVATPVAGMRAMPLARTPLVYLGTISYGVYLVHGFMPYILGRYIPGFVDLGWPIRFLALTGATVAAASASWHGFEAPILALKRRWSPPAPALDTATRAA